jgi:hypothetical protein
MNWERVGVARQSARSLLLFAGLLVYFAISGHIAAPHTMGTLREGETVASIPISDLPTVLGLVGMVVGLGWMWRIYRAPTRFEGAHWRFRDH